MPLLSKITFISAQVCLVENDHIGYNSIIRSGALVTKDIPPKFVAVGVISSTTD